jgi:hypothetical protein
MKSRERMLDETVERQRLEIEKLNQIITDMLVQRAEQRPTFIVKMTRNALGQVGALLCWPDGTIVEDQIECAVTTTVDALVRVVVTFHAGIKLITIKEDYDGDTTDQSAAGNDEA